MFLYVLIGLAAVVVLFIVVVALQPADFSITRQAVIGAPPATVFPLVNDFHRWTAWSPWEKVDPALKRTYEGAAAGTGAIYRWEGNRNVGAGNMTITESRSSELIRIRLEFLKPFKGINPTEFTFRADGGQTVVTWTMSGKKVFLTKAIHLLVSMEKMIGGQFEEGLANMKSVAEAKS